MRTEMQIGKTLVIVHSEFSSAATETLEAKIEELLLRHIDAAKSLTPFCGTEPIWSATIRRCLSEKPTC